MVKTELTDVDRHTLLNVTKNVCTLCKKQGYIFTQDAQGYNVPQDCECVKKYAKLVRYYKAGIYRRYWDWEPTDDILSEDFKVKNAENIATLRDIGENMDSFVSEGKTLFMWGPVGTGKTAMSMWLLKQALEILIQKDLLAFKYECGLMTLRELVNLLVEAQMDQTKKPLVEFIEGLDLLFIDEFDKEHNTGDKSKFSGVAFGDIFNSFYNRRKSMIVVSNYSFEELKDSGIHTYDVIDRLSEFDYMLTLVGTSYRGKNYKEAKKEWQR